MSKDFLSSMSIRRHFRNSIENALKNQSITPKEITAAYLVDLLCQYATTRLDEILNQPLGIMMAKAQRILPEQGTLKLKKVGDHALYLLGFFTENIKNRQLEPEYFTNLGQTAYRRLGKILNTKNRATQLVQVYSELADRFPFFVRVLADVRDRGGWGSGQSG
ncbi:MAG: hypothetical protein V1754_14315 [Pseudomonadota bacterium]